MAEAKAKEGKQARVEVKKISSQAQLAAVLEEAGDKLVVIDFFADWCGPCRVISPRVSELANSHTNVIFIKINIDESDEIVDKYGVSSIPTFVFIKGGEKLDSLIGANYDLLTKKVKEHETPLPKEELST